MVSLPAPVVHHTRMSAGASRRGFDHPETGAGTLTNAGIYKVNWRAVSTDTHKIEGSFTFRVDAQ
jgi:methionine-rich copper-binding protein CopC